MAEIVLLWRSAARACRPGARSLYARPTRGGRMLPDRAGALPAHVSHGAFAMSSAPVLHSLDERGVATVALNRPEVGNAYNDDMIQGLLAAMDALSARPELRVV